MLRFAAFFGVFIFHAVPQRLALLSKIAAVGALGMCLFFVLSSFLITELLRLEKQKSGTVHISKFYLRRILRIWPLYLSFLLFTFILGHHSPVNHLSGKAVASFLLLYGNIYTAQHGASLGIATALWSISVEEQFYLVWPTLCRHLGGKGLTVVSALLIPIGALTIYILSSSGHDANTSMWLNSFVQFQMFGMGALLALCLNGRVPKLSLFQRSLLLCGSVLAFCLAQFVFHIHRSTPSEPASLICGYLCAGVGSSLLILTILGWALPSPFRVFVYLGKISFGLYVFHLAFLQLANVLIGSNGFFGGIAKLFLALTGTIVAAMISYRFLEAPFIRLKGRLAIIPSRSV